MVIKMEHGHSIFILADIMNMVESGAIEIFRGVDAIYSDPPWNQSVTTAFYRRAGLLPKRWSEIIDAIFKAAEILEVKIIFLDMGVRNLPYLMEGGGVAYKTQYGRGRPAYLWANRTDFKGPEKILKGWESSEFVIRTMKDLGVKSMLDPCCGVGTIPMMANSSGLIGHGIELQKEKFEIAGKRLRNT